MPGAAPPTPRVRRRHRPRGGGGCAPSANATRSHEGEAGFGGGGGVREGERARGRAGQLSPLSPNCHLALTDLTRKTCLICQLFPIWDPTSLMLVRYRHQNTPINSEETGVETALFHAPSPPRNQSRRGGVFAENQISKTGALGLTRHVHTDILHLSVQCSVSTQLQCRLWHAKLAFKSNYGF